MTLTTLQAYAHCWSMADTQERENSYTIVAPPKLEYG
jgi:hypothetical protein